MSQRHIRTASFQSVDGRQTDIPPFDTSAAEPHAGWSDEQLYCYAAAHLELHTAKGLWRGGRALLMTRDRAADDEIWLAAAACYVRRPMPMLLVALMVARRPFPGANETTAAVCLSLLYAADPAIRPKRGTDDSGGDGH